MDNKDEEEATCFEEDLMDVHKKDRNRESDPKQLGGVSRRKVNRKVMLYTGEEASPELVQE
eukprot:4785645-Ditylum_brightwellii.AAC.1